MVTNIHRKQTDDPAIELAVISAVLSSNFDLAIDKNICLAGKVGLSGEIRAVTRIKQRIAEAEKLGMKKIFIPPEHLIIVREEVIHRNRAGFTGRRFFPQAVQRNQIRCNNLVFNSISHVIA